MEVVYMGWTQVGPEGTSELHEEVAQVPMVPISATLPTLSSPLPIASWRVLYDWSLDRGRLRFTDGSTQYAYITGM